MKKNRIICAAVCLLSIILLAVLTVMRARVRRDAGIIGGAGMPTLLFSLRQTLCSPACIMLLTAALLSLIGIFVSSAGKRR